jgi:hypothetical protein
MTTVACRAAPSPAPVLQRLLADVAAGQIDIIVVCKVDRLTRSLLDFAKLVEAFDAAGTSFVSVTKSFNTNTSVGRLTLNMLLSFAELSARSLSSASATRLRPASSRACGRVAFRRFATSLIDAASRSLRTMPCSCAPPSSAT